MDIRGIMLNEKCQSQSHVLSDSIYITFFKWQNRDGEQISDCQGLDMLPVGEGVE